MARTSLSVIFSIVALSILQQVCGQGTQFSYNGLANTPQMGWVEQLTA